MNRSKAIDRLLIKSGAAAVAVTAALWFGSSAIYQAAKSEPAPAPSMSVTDTPAVTTAPGSAERATAALEALEHITVKGKAAATGYARSQFGQAWKDINHTGCDTRNQLLKAGLRDVQIKPGTHGCVVLSGVLDDPYTGQQIAFQRGGASEVDVDHLVTLKSSWLQGAQQWDQTKREAFANDPANLQLTSAAQNRQKRDSGLDAWLPKNRAYWCDYVARIVNVKASYGLSMTPSEHDRAQQILTRCQGK